ncbi:MAG: nucleoid-associated protein [Pontibacterium sp.]
MELKHLAIRELAKNAEEESAQVSDQGGVMDVHNSMVKNLFSALLSAFERRSSLTHGSFTQENEEGYPFISAFEKFLVNEDSPHAFNALTDAGMSQLAAAIISPSARKASGGYVIYAIYGSDRYDYMLIALVRDKSSIALDAALNPTEVIEVNLEQLHQAARINITTFKQGKDSYLSFIGSKQKGDITHYFSTAFGCTDVVPSRKSTSELIQASRDFCKQHDLGDKKEDIVEDVVNYLERQRSDKQTANLNDVEHIFDAYIPPEQVETVSGTFGNFANGGPYNVSHEFQPHTSTINRFAKLKAKSDSWQLDFTKKALGRTGSDRDVVFDEENGSLTLKHLPTKVMEQIRQALNEQDET